MKIWKRASKFEWALIVCIPLFVLWLLLRPLDVSWNLWGMGFICHTTGNTQACQKYRDTAEKIDQAMQKHLQAR